MSCILPVIMGGWGMEYLDVRAKHVAGEDQRPLPLDTQAAVALGVALVQKATPFPAGMLEINALTNPMLRLSALSGAKRQAVSSGELGLQAAYNVEYCRGVWEAEMLKERDVDEEGKPLHADWNADKIFDLAQAITRAEKLGVLSAESREKQINLLTKNLPTFQKHVWAGASEGARNNDGSVSAVQATYDLMYYRAVCAETPSEQKVYDVMEAVLVAGKVGVLTEEKRDAEIVGLMENHGPRIKSLVEFLGTVADGGMEEVIGKFLTTHEAAREKKLEEALKKDGFGEIGSSASAAL